MRTSLLLYYLLLLIALGACKNNPYNTTTGKTIPVSSHEKKESVKESFIIPKPVSWVNDYDSLFTKVQRDSLEMIISAFEKRTTNQISVFTFDSTYVNKEDFEKYILAVHNTWGVGTKEKKNGILIGIATDYRLVRSSNGYGIEKILSDSTTKVIIDNDILPHFKNSHFFEGTKSGINALIQKLDSVAKR